MANIDIENISNSDLNGNDLFQDSESFITELDDNGESIVGGYYGGYGGNNCGATHCGNTIGYCKDTAGCHNTIGG